MPTGFLVNGKVYRNASLRSIRGIDLEVMNDMAAVSLPSERITDLLIHCLTNLGPKATVTKHDVRSLIVGDRDALLLHLRRLTLGNKILSVVTCPRKTCQEKMDLDFSISDILQDENNNARPFHDIVVQHYSDIYRVRFRLPTGADQDIIGRVALRDPKAASELLVRRCIHEIWNHNAKIEFENTLPKILIDSLSQRMAELDPQAEILFNLICPSCNKNFIIYFDIGYYFFKELLANSQELYREIHILAQHYHWSEKDILNFSCAKRRMYLEFLADAMIVGGH